MAFVSGFLLFLFFIIIVLALAFFGGLTFLIVGIITKKVNKKGKVFPVVSIIIGILLMAPAVISVGCVATVGGVSAIKEQIALSKAQTLPETWIAKGYVDSRAAGSEAYIAAITAADHRDIETFKECFALSVRRDRDFDDAVDAFFEEYPGGIMSMGLLPSGGASDRSDDGAHGSIAYLGFSGDNWYIVSLSYCTEHEGHDEDVGITSLVIRDLGTQAQYNIAYNESGGTLEKPYLLCDTDVEGEISARLIGNAAIIWNDDGRDLLSKDEIREILDTYDTLQDAIDAGALGEPQGAIKYYNHTGYYYFYELEPEDGEPRYVHIVTSEPYGDIGSAYYCAPDRTLYSESFNSQEDEEG